MEMVMDMIVYTMGMTVYTCTVFCPVPSVPHLCLFPFRLPLSIPAHTGAIEATSAVEAPRKKPKLLIERIRVGEGRLIF